MQTLIKAERTNANDHFKQFTGTDHYYKYMLGYTCTDGAMQVAQDCECYWFLDVIASYHRHVKVRNEGFQVWKLSRVKGNNFKVTCEDGNDNILITQRIPYSDFKYDDLTMWAISKVIMLPSEY